MPFSRVVHRNVSKHKVREHDWGDLPGLSGTVGRGLGCGAFMNPSDSALGSALISVLQHIQQQTGKRSRKLHALRL